MEITTAKVLSAIRAAIVPPLCVCCREPELSGRPLCVTCERRLKPVGACGDRSPVLDSVWAGFEYEGAARDLVHALKTRSVLSAASAMAAAMARQATPDLAGARLVPVPAHAARERRLGFNHATALARAFGKQMGSGVSELLQRSSSQRQTGKGRHERIANVLGTVTARPRAAGLDAVTLVDDVYTTGATLDACALALREAGVRHVAAVTFARAAKY